jgi:uncharacterized cupin superfamily protein
MRTRYLCVAAMLAGSAGAQVPLEQEPRHHVLFANEALRVISPQIPPGDTTLQHLHTHDEVTVCIHGSEVRAKQPGADFGKAGMSCMPGRIGVTEYTGNPRSHTVQNTGASVYHLVLVENLKDSGWTTYDAPEGRKPVRESRSFRIYDEQLAGSSGPHAHQVPSVIVLVSGEVTAGGKHLDQPGAWAYFPAGDKHQIVAKGDAHLVEIEVR